MPLYTRSGDDGITGLATGQRVSKNSPLVTFIGELDELNALIGLSVAYLQEEETDFTEECEVLESIQRDIFSVSAIAVGAQLSFTAKSETANIEKTIDDYERLVKPLRNFILPGGAVCAAQLHLARTKTRSIERLAVSLKSKSVEPFYPYLNRLSDLLFVMARYVNMKLKEPESVWKGR